MLSQQPVLLPYADPGFEADPFPLYRQLREDGFTPEGPSRAGSSDIAQRPGRLR